MLNHIEIPSDSPLAKFPNGCGGAAMTIIYNAIVSRNIRQGQTILHTIDGQQMAVQALAEVTELCRRVLGNRQALTPLDGPQLMEACCRRALQILDAEGLDEPVQQQAQPHSRIISCLRALRVSAVNVLALARFWRSST